MNPATLDLPRDIQEKIALLAERQGKTFVEAGLMALRFGLGNYLARKSTARETRPSPSMHDPAALQAAFQSFVSDRKKHPAEITNGTKSKGFPPTQPYGRIRSLNEIRGLADPARPLIPLGTSEVSTSEVLVGNGKSGIGLRKIHSPSKITVGCVCSVCGDIFQVAPEDQFRLQEAKRKTGKRPRCEKCGGNAEMLASAARA